MYCCSALIFNSPERVDFCLWEGAQSLEKFGGFEIFELGSLQLMRQYRRLIIKQNW